VSQFRQQAAAGALAVGTTFRLTRTFSADEVERFGALTRDWNPVHHDPRWCELKRFDGPICHGLLVGSMICEPGGQVGWLATGMSFRFRRPVYIGDTVTCELTIDEIDERGCARASCRFENQRGETVLTGTLEGFLPGAEERALLGRMLEEE
jgi:acyl dehydratase